ncbi:hypothetical protein ScPMuIL_016125 [Solemya velum]
MSSVECVVRVLSLVMLQFGNCAVFYKDEGSTVDVINIIRQYALVCGVDHVCDKTILKFAFIPQFVVDHKAVCPICSCSDNCYSQNDCCPDKILLGPELDCINTMLVSKPGSTHTSKYQMVVDCPSPNIDLREKCSAQDDSNRNVYNTPVTSQNGMTYRNRYCALCHNSSDFVAWQMSIQCTDEGDISEFNYVTSMQETVNLADYAGCELQYSSSAPKTECVDTESIIDRCNTTGKWTNYDGDIEWACQKYPHAQQFRFFRNIFCYICNPTVVAADSISACDKNMGWSDPNLNRACVDLPGHYRTYPYKNIFCYYCNHPKILFSDIETTLDDLLNEDHISVAFGFESFLANVTHYPRKIPGVLKHGNPDIQNVNLTNILYNYVLVEGAGLCNPDDFDIPLTKIPPGECSCAKSCILDQTCCIDVALTTPNYCMSDQLLTDTTRESETKFIIVNDCPNLPDNDKIRILCENDDDLGIKSKIPVYSSTTRLSYKNIYCAICHEVDIINDTFEQRNEFVFFDPWEIQIKCYPFTDFSFFTIFEDVLGHARDINCIVRFVSGYMINSFKCFDENRNKTGYCNTTGLLQVNDEDIEWACERLNSPYIRNSNLFCDICNPSTVSTTDVIDTCNATGSMFFVDPKVEYGCEHFPKHNSSSPYKNGFCRVCNTQITFDSNYHFPDIAFSPMQRVTYIEEPLFRTSYRSMFAFNSVIEVDVEQINTHNCSRGHVYDKIKKKSCKKIHCSPGKILENNKCVPFWKQGSYLRYRLFFRLEANLNDSVTDIHSLLQRLDGSISDEISASVRSPIQFVTRYLTTDVSCNLTTDQVAYTVPSLPSSTKHVQVKILYHSCFVVTFQVNRLETEASLLQMRNRTFFVGTDDNIIEFKAERDVDAYYIPSRINMLKAMDKCYIFEFGTFKSKKLRKITPLFEIVSDCMTCRQIPILTDFQISATTHQANVQFLNRRFDIDQYRLISREKISVCIDDYIPKTGNNSRKISNRMVNALGIFTAVCTCLSLACLLISFITYCLFRSLRTLPGKNNMCLILSLFFAQMTFQFGAFQNEDDTICLAVGIASHYFWLATFCCMSVCCLHMFLTFNIRFLSLFDKDDSSVVVKRYCLFSFGLPLVIVSLNYGINYAVFGSENSGYGPHICFLTNPYSVGFSLALPLILSTAANVIFFAFTMKNIRSSSKIRNTKIDRQQCVVYVKLFVLTGLTWLLQIIDSNVGISAFSFFVTFLNGCQGVFIFASYICNHRVFLLYKTMCCKTKKRETNSKSHSSEFKSGNTVHTQLTEYRT